MAFTVNELKQKTIYQLREIGVKIGVRAPTAKNKQDLILSIMDVSSGNVQPYKGGAGRPRKNFPDVESIKIEQQIQDTIKIQEIERKTYEKIVDMLVDKIRNYLLLAYDK